MYYKLFSNCILVKGAKRMLICDLDCEEFFLIDNIFYGAFIDESLIDIEQLYRLELSNDIVISFVDFLKENNLVFEIETLEENELYPPLPMQWDFPSVISNAICDFNFHSLNFINHYIRIIRELNELGCRSISLRFFDSIDNNLLDLLIGEIKKTLFMTSDLYIMYDKYKNRAYLNTLSNDDRINNVIVHGYNADSPSGYNENIYLMNKTISSELSCGIIKDYYFSLKLSHFTEARKHNTCLNRKISIDKEGNIKNCPSMQQKYGNIFNGDSLCNAINDHFMQYWHIAKDDISICNVCEFRYVCSDCRAYLENPHDIHSKPLKCGYNPYTAVWEDWSQNSLKKKAIQYYGLDKDMDF